MVWYTLLFSLVLTLLLAATTFAKEEPKEDLGTVIGIDLGTTYSVYIDFLYF